jgi:hypothetical protein
MNQIDQARVDACLAQHEVRVAEPLADPFQLEQRGVGEHLGEAVGIDQMPAVFWRRGALTVDDNCCGTVILGGKTSSRRSASSQGGGNDYWLSPSDVADTYRGIGRIDDAIAVLRADSVRQPAVHAYRSLLGFAATI